MTRAESLRALAELQVQALVSAAMRNRADCTQDPAVLALAEAHRVLAAEGAYLDTITVLLAQVAELRTSLDLGTACIERLRAARKRDEFDDANDKLDEINKGGWPQ